MMIQFFGDMAFVGDLAKPNGKDIFKKIGHLLKEADYNVWNLECVLTEKSDAYPGKCNLKASPQWAKVLKENKFNVANLANNHIMDFKWDGLKDTLKVLAGNNILIEGAGRNKDEAAKPLFLQVGSIKIALLGRCNVDVSSPVFANHGPGISEFNLIELIETILHIKDKVDYIILIIHWGVEHYQYPTPHQRHIARKLIDAGVDLIVGHHPHVLQGYEKTGNGWVFYSLGNFVFDDFTWTSKDKNGTEIKHYTKMENINRQGGILRVLISKKNGISWIFYPTYFEKKSGVKILSKIKLMESLSKPFRFPFYNLFWVFYSMKMEWRLRLFSRFSFKKILRNIYKIRWHHFKELFQLLKRSLKITGGKSTNPYE